MFIKSVTNQSKELHLTIYKNNIALIFEKRETIKSKVPSTIEYHNISNFINEDSLLINNVDINEINFNYSSYSSNIRTLTTCNQSDLKPVSFTIKNFPANIKEIEVYYLSNEIDWNYCYNIFLDNDLFSFKSWFVVLNKTSTSFHNAKVKFVSGNINSPPFINTAHLNPKVSTLNISEDDKILQETLEDYYIYSLQDSYSINNNSTKRINHLSISDIKYEKYYNFYYYSNNAHIIIEFENKKSNNLGLSLPSGNAYVYANKNNKLEFIGGNKINNTFINDSIVLDIGTASDIHCERIILNRKTIDSYEINTIKFIVKNNSNNNIKTIISHPIFIPWSMEYSSEEYFKNDDNNPYFVLSINKNDMKEITFEYKIKI